MKPFPQVTPASAPALGRTSRGPCWALAAMMGLCSSAAILAQDAPGDAAAPAPAAPAAPAAAEAEPELTGSEKKDPLVRSVLESNPTTPEQLAQSIKILLDIGQPAAAKPLVARLAALKLEPGQMDHLLEQFGSSIFIDMTRTPEIAAAARPFVQALLAGAEAFRNDPARLAKMIAMLNSPDRYTWQTALHELQRAHEAGAVALLGALADGARAGQQDAIAAALAALGVDARGPVRGALATNDAALQARLIALAAQLDDRQATMLLVRAAVDPQFDPQVSAAARAAIERLSGAAVHLADGRLALAGEIRKLLAAALRQSGSDQADTEVWRWDAEKKLPFAVSVPQAVAWADRAARLAVDLAAIAPDPAAQRLALIARLTAAKLDQDLDQPLPTGPGAARDAAIAAGAEAVDQALAVALASENPHAATALAEVLGEIGYPELLTRHGARPAPLAVALQDPHRRVRFAALGAIVKIAPTTRFDGAGFVAPSLGYFAATTGTPRVLIGHPRADMAQALAGLLTASGYESDVAASGREAFQMATRSPDYDFLLLHYSIQDSELDDLLTSLRRDPRTRLMPIGILALMPDLPRAKHIAESVPPALALIEPGAALVMKLRVEELMGLEGRRHVPPAERKREAGEALAWIRRLAENSPAIYDLRPLAPALIETLFVPTLESAASEAIASVGTAPGEKALLTIVNSDLQPLAARQTAAKALARCIALHGVLLTSAEIVRQYDVYNASEKAPREVQELLGSVLDAVESNNPNSVPAQPPSSPPEPAKSQR